VLRALHLNISGCHGIRLHRKEIETPLTPKPDFDLSVLTHFYGNMMRLTEPAFSVLI
jgi:hypothetical protein